MKQAKWLVLAALLASLPAAPAAVDAQVVVTSDQDLQFGFVTPGVVATVPVTDPTRRAQLTIDGRGRFSVTFQLPQQLTGPNGEAMPLAFGAADGLLERANIVTAFDPAVGTSVVLNPAQPLATVYLGGQALPVPGQTAGSYTATIVMMIVQTGN